MCFILWCFWVSILHDSRVIGAFSLVPISEKHMNFKKFNGTNKLVLKVVLDALHGGGGRFAACGPSASAGAASEAQANHNLRFGCCSCGRSRTTNSEMSSVFSCSNVENVCRTPSSLSGSRHWTSFILRTEVTRVVHKLRAGFVYKIFLNGFLCTKVLKSLAIFHYLFQADLYNYLSDCIEFNHHAFYSS